VEGIREGKNEKEESLVVEWETKMRGPATICLVCSVKTENEQGGKRKRRNLKREPCISRITN
jgi:hypothetical protein